MKQFSIYALLSMGLFLTSLLLLNVDPFLGIYEIIEYIVVPLWEHPFSELSLLLTELGSLPAAFIFFTFITLALVVEGHWRRALVIACAGILTAILTFITKEIIGIPRPLEQLQAVSGFRFPSGHASASMAMALSFIYIVFGYTRSLIIRTPLVLIALSFTGIIGATRIFMNVHRPLDIIAGFSVALFSMSVALMLARRLDVLE